MKDTLNSTFPEILEHTRQIAGKWPPLIPITLLGLKEKKISTKNDFCKKKHF